MSKAENGTEVRQVTKIGHDEGRPEELAGAKVASAKPSTMSTPELITEITRDVKMLVMTQIELAKTELRGDLSREGKMVAGLGLSALLALLAVNLLFVTAVLGLASLMPAWVAGLAVTGAVVVVAGVVGAVGWGKRVREPLARTRHELKEDLRWTKERVV